MRICCRIIVGKEKYEKSRGSATKNSIIVDLNTDTCEARCNECRKEFIGIPSRLWVCCLRQQPPQASLSSVVTRIPSRCPHSLWPVLFFFFKLFIVQTGISLSAIDGNCLTKNASGITCVCPPYFWKFDYLK